MGKLKNKRRWEELPGERETGAEKEKRQTEEGKKGGGDKGGERRRDDESRKAAAAAVVAGEEEEETAAEVVVAEKKKRTEEKTEKIERLKSGFKICKPHGTFLWPNMGINLQKQLPLSPVPQLGDLFLIGGGPPSVNSSSTVSPPFPQQPSYNDLHGSQLSPVRRPLPERRTFSATLRPLISESPRHENCGSSNCTATTTTPIINLNDLPISVSGDWIQPCHKIPTIISPCMQQQQEEQMAIASSSTAAAAESGGGRSGRGGGRKTIRQVGGSWLALATPNSV